jgi:hypothetical protein
MKSGLATVLIGADSVGQFAYHFAEPSNDARLGPAEGHGRDAEPGGEGESVGIGRDNLAAVSCPERPDDLL